MTGTSDARPLGVSGRVARAFLQAQLTPLIALVLLLVGAFAVAVTPKEEEPQINVTMANVLIPFPGASSRDVHALVAVPAEQVLSQITGVEHLTSVSRPGLAILTVQFKVGEPRTEALVKLYDTLMSNRDWLPAHLGVLEPVVKPRGIDDVPIVALTLHSRRADATAADLERIAHELETEIKRVPGTREVTTIGGPGRVVRVSLDPERMNAHRVTVTDIERALRAVNQSLPAGTLVRGNQTVEVRAGEFVRSATEVGELVVGLAGPTRERRPVLLADVAHVADGADTPQAYVWHGAPTGESGAREFREAPAVTIAVSKKAGANAATVADGVAERVAQLQGQLVPADVVVTTTRNYGATASDKANQLIKKLIFATLSVIALVWATLGRREAVIVGTAVVLTLAATLFASWAWGFTLNRVSLFALIFSIGILVDDAIVVVENIHRRAQLDQLPMLQVIPRAVDEVGGPTILATLTVIAALLPMAFVSGLMGPYMAPIPINASLGMLLSLAIAFVITPWLALRLLPATATAHATGRQADRLGRLFERVMRPFLRADAGRRARRQLGLGIAAAIALSVALVPLGAVVLKMLPFDNKSEFQVVVDLPTGAPVEATAALLRELAVEVGKVPEVSHYQAYAGLAAPINFNGLVRQYYLRRGGEVGDLQVNLVDKAQRHRKSHEIAQAVRPALEAIARRHGADLKVVEVPPGPPVLSPIVAELYGPDAEATMELAKQVRGVFERTPDITAIDDTVLDPAERLVLRVDAAKAAQFGIPAAEVTRIIAAALGGADVTPLHDGASKYAVPVRIGLADTAKGSLDAVLKLRVRGDDSVRDAATGLPFEVPLSELVRATSLPREHVYYRKDLQPVAYVTGDVAGGPGKTDSPLYGMFAMRPALEKLAAPGGLPLTEHWVAAPGDRYGAFGLKWDGEWQVTYETFRDMGLAYAVGLVLIYLLVVAQFRSYVTPLVIMAPIPLTVIGVLPGHALLGAQFTATSMIGMIALAGIIVRNSILLVDFIHHRLDEGADFAQATIDAAATRAKPIVLTALAAMLGALFILDDPIFNGLAISLLFGIFVSTALTLVLIPVLYYALNHRRRQAAVEGALLSAQGASS